MADAEPAAVRVGRGLVAGVIAGAVASFAMDRFQAVLAPSDDGGEPATEQAADGIARQLTGQPVAEAARPLAGQTIHYALGMVMGAAYGVAAEFRPAVTAGYGTGFAVGTATVFDQAAVPAAGLGDPPWRADPGTTAYAYASHLVFGAVTEFVRRRVAATLFPSA